MGDSFFVFYVVMYCSYLIFFQLVLFDFVCGNESVNIYIMLDKQIYYVIFIDEKYFKKLKEKKLNNLGLDGF